MKITIFKAARCASFLFLAGFALPAFAGVQSVSLERTFVGKDIRVLEVKVKCKFNNQGRRLRKVVSQKNKPWCSVDLPDMCANRKIVLAREICGFSPDEFDGLLAARNGEAKQSAAPESKPQRVATAMAKKADTSDNLLQEQMLIEEQRIQLEQQRLELRKREISLKKELSSL